MSTRGVAVLLLAIGPLTLSAQDFARVESVDRPLARENPDELALVLETGTGRQIGLDLLVVAGRTCGPSEDEQATDRGSLRTGALAANRN